MRTTGPSTNGHGKDRVFFINKNYLYRKESERKRDEKKIQGRP